MYMFILGIFSNRIGNEGRYGGLIGGFSFIEGLLGFIDTLSEDSLVFNSLDNFLLGHDFEIDKHTSDLWSEVVANFLQDSGVQELSQDVSLLLWFQTLEVVPVLADGSEIELLGCFGLWLLVGFLILLWWSVLHGWLVSWLVVASHSTSHWHGSTSTFHWWHGVHLTSTLLWVSWGTTTSSWTLIWSSTTVGHLLTWEAATSHLLSWHPWHLRWEHHLWESEVWVHSHWLLWETTSLLNGFHSLTILLWHSDIDEWFLLVEEGLDFLGVLLAEDSLDLLLGVHLDEGVLGLVLLIRVWCFGGLEGSDVHPLEGGTKGLEKFFQLWLGDFSL